MLYILLYALEYSIWLVACGMEQPEGSCNVRIMNEWFIVKRRGKPQNETEPPKRREVHQGHPNDSRSSTNTCFSSQEHLGLTSSTKFSSHGWWGRRRDSACAFCFSVCRCLFFSPRQFGCRLCLASHGLRPNRAKARDKERRK